MAEETGRACNSPSSLTPDSSHLTPWHHGEALASFVLQCLQQPSTSARYRLQLRQSAINVFLTSQSNPSIVPDAALLEGLLTLCDVPQVTTDAEYCFILLAASSPASWQFVTASPSARCNPHLSTTLLNIYVHPMGNENGASDRQSVTLLQDILKRMSNLDFWESRAYLTTIPKTPFSLALRAALREYDSGGGTHPHDFERSRLSALAKSSETHDWEPVSDDEVHRVLSIWPENVSMPCERLFLQKKERTAATPTHKLQHSGAVLELICTVPELATNMNRQLTSTQRANALSEKVYNAELSTAAVYTIIKGLTDTATIYTPESFLVLQTFLNSIVVHAEKNDNFDSMIVVDMLEFLLSEGRDVNGIPDRFLPIATPVITVISSAALSDPSVKPRLCAMLRQISKGRITCSELRKLADLAGTALERIRQNRHSSKRGG